MNILKAVWSERTNILSLLNTTAIALVALVLWIQMPYTSRENFAKFDATSYSIDKLTDRLDHPLTVQSDNLDKLIERFDHPLSVTVSVPFKVDATVEGKQGLANPVEINNEGTVNATVEGGSPSNPVHISNP